MTPRQFHQLCAEHDWTYEFSDDHRSWVRGRDQKEKIIAAIRSDESLAPIYVAWVTHINSRTGVPAPQMPE